MRSLSFLFDPQYWRWRWSRIGSDAKVLALLVLAAAVGAAGYFSAKGLAGASETNGAYVPPTPRVVTVVQTRSRPGRVVTQLQPVTEVQRRTVTAFAPAQTVLQPITVARPGSIRAVTQTLQHTTTVRGPVETVVRAVTVQRPARVITSQQTQTVVQAQTVERPVTITTAITRPVTVTGPAQTVTIQGQQGRERTVTVTAPTQTVTTQVTQPARTVTQTVTATNTVTVTTSK
jgi:hypothetical protein